MPGSNLIPALVYDDAPAAIAWLESAFGLLVHARFDMPDGKVAHAQLTLGHGRGMVMVSSRMPGTPMAGMLAHPSVDGSLPTGCVYLVVDDARATHATAEAADADVVMALQAMDYGGWAFTCRDPEGHLWSVGDYDPWAGSQGEP